jgi:hypothetical protein
MLNVLTLCFITVCDYSIFMLFFNVIVSLCSCVESALGLVCLAPEWVEITCSFSLWSLKTATHEVLLPPSLLQLYLFFHVYAVHTPIHTRLIKHTLKLCSRDWTFVAASLSELELGNSFLLMPFLLCTQPTKYFRTTTLFKKYI